MRWTPWHTKESLTQQGFRFAIVVSRFNSFVTDRLLEGALDALKRHGADDSRIEIFRVPGAFEIPLAAKLVVKRKDVDGVICLGAVIKGGTPHFHYVASEVTKGIAHRLPGERKTCRLRHPYDRDRRAGGRAGGDEGGEQGLRRRVVGDRDGKSFKG